MMQVQGKKNTGGTKSIIPVMRTSVSLPDKSVTCCKSKKKNVRKVKTKILN